jgi:hypothetical protein
VQSEIQFEDEGIALLSQEGSGIAKRIPRGVVLTTKPLGFATPPALRATVPDIFCSAKWFRPHVA